MIHVIYLCGLDIKGTTGTTVKPGLHSRPTFSCQVEHDGNQFEARHPLKRTPALLVILVKGHLKGRLTTVETAL